MIHTADTKHWEEELFHQLFGFKVFTLNVECSHVLINQALVAMWFLQTFVTNL